MSRKWFSIVLFSILAYSVYSTYIPKYAISGVYKNVNYENSSSFLNKMDKLTLNSNNTFKSESFGTGTYKIEYSINGTRIDFKPTFELGINLKTSISRTWTGAPRILLFKDLSHYYIKI